MKTIAFVCAALLLGAAALIQAQPGGGGGGRGQGRRGGPGMGLEGEWAVICFEMKIDGEQFTKLRVVYQEAWVKRRDLMEQMRSAGSGDWEEMAPKLQKLQEELAEKYRTILSKEQVARFESLVEERRGGFGGGGGRGGPGGGGGGR
ncbi:MAG: hypothetical protein HYW07_04955 [Candidatus Latescibacteria bacterium]|nr:hypothetical protein [Candidatus Latescibacterota bacterium]